MPFDQEVGAAHQHDRARGAAGTRVGVCLTQAPALLRAHRPVVEIEVEVADAGVLLVEDLAKGLAVGDRRVERRRHHRHVHLLAGQGQGACRGQLEELLRGLVAALQVRDPDGAVDGGAADCAAALGDDRAGSAAQRSLGVRAEEVELHVADPVEHAGIALGGTDLAEDPGARIRGPLDRALRLAQHRKRAPGDVGVVVVERGRREARVVDAGDGLDERLDGAPAHLVAVEAALADGARRELARAPDVTAVHLAGGLEHGHAPLAHAELDRPVERRRAAVPDRARVNDEAAVLRVHRLRDDLREEGADDQLGPVHLDCGLHGRPGVHHRHRHLVSELGQRPAPAGSGCCAP